MNSKIKWSVQTAGNRSLPPVVLLHSIATCGAMWSPQMAVWSSSFHLIVPDLPGHGATPVDGELQTFEDYADALARVLDDFGMERVAVVGVSFGGMIAQAFALRFSERLSAMVLAQTLARVNPEGAAMWDARKRLAREQGMRPLVSPTLERWLTGAFRAAAPLTTQWVGDMIAATEVEGFCAAASAIQGLDFFQRLATVTTPTLVVAGAEDSAAAPAVASAISERIPGAQLTIIENAAHQAGIEQPTVFAEAVGGFLKKFAVSHA